MRSTQCPEGTRACFTRTVTRGETKVVQAVIRAGIDSAEKKVASKQSAQLRLPLSHASHTISAVKGGVELTIPGDTWATQPQSFFVSIKCATEEGKPTFAKYENGVLTVEWTTPAGCPGKRSDTGGGGDDSNPPRGSGGGSLRMFFLLCVDDTRGRSAC